ncbi:MAG: sensor histidine kinase [Blautia sp.]|nr:sensor histidine kinase [Blautia sp.]MDY5032533.1 sensor histidine kinase [Blautia sp.]
MSFFAFLKDKSLLLLLQVLCMLLLAGFLLVTGYPSGNILLILIFWILILAVWLTTVYLQRRQFFQEADRILEKMDQRYLLGELLPGSCRLEDQLYREMIRRSNKSVIERIRQMEDEQKEYQEYMESWVHEIKAPITCISLLCENRRRSGPVADKSQETPGEMPDREVFQTICLENQKIENAVDMVLYLARGQAVYKDYLIRETDLQEVVCEVLEKNRLLLIRNQIRAEVDCNETVYTDRKWLAFVIHQMILNSVKYRREAPVLHILAKRTERGVILTIKDNGVGIRQEELGRIFEKGFTGSNGRDRERSTGMGLYLCRKLCDKLGIGLRAESVYGEETSMILDFPVSAYIRCGECTDVINTETIV